jgi:hypothetical protein
MPRKLEYKEQVYRMRAAWILYINDPTNVRLYIRWMAVSIRYTDHKLHLARLKHELNGVRYFEDTMRHLTPFNLRPPQSP